MAAKLSVVHFKIRHRATGLTPPPVAAQDLVAQPFVRDGVQSQASGLGANLSLRRPLAQVFEEGLLLFAGQEFVVA